MSTVEMSPFPFQSNIYSKTKKDKLKQDLDSTVASLFYLCVKSTKSLKSAATHSSHETTSNPLWRLLIIFQGCVLCPLPRKRPKRQSIGRVVANRLRRFRSGHVETLYSAAMAIPCLSPGDVAEKAAQSQYPPFASAQSSADMGNIGAVRKSLKGNSKPCVMTTANQKICAKLYPARIEKRGAHKFDPVGNPIHPPPVADFGMEYDDATALRLFG